MNISFLNNIGFTRVDSINESILDPINKTRCKDVFNDNDAMKPEVKKQILEILNDWIRSNNLKYNSVTFSGSSSGFQYTDYSDIDIGVWLDTPDADTFKKAIRTLPNGNLLTGTAHPINFFAIDDNRTKFDMGTVENLYDVLNDKWKKKTVKVKVNVPFTYIDKLSRVFTDSMDHALSQFEKYKFEYQQYKAMDLSKLEISEKEWNEHIEDYERNLRECCDSMRLLLHIFHGFQDEAFKSTPFKINIKYTSDDPRFSVNNLIYKTIDRLGYKDKLANAITEAQKLVNKTDPETLQKG